MFSTTLLNWFALNGRDLPWRHTKDAYAIWLSEVILQQTRIQQGMDYWLRFMQRWPRVEDLAAATEDEVLREWQGLGYYSRARNLHAAAQQIAANGSFPNTLDGIKKLKGVGDYTAAAIGSIAFGLPAAVVDGNVYRVLARHYGIDTPINTTQGKRLFTELAQSLLPVDQPASFNQAMMDFGAIQCTPTSPKCVLCPLQESCEAFRSGRVGELPVKEKKLTIQTRRFTYMYIRCQGKTAIRKRAAGDIWQGLWEPVLAEGCGMLAGAKLLRKDVKHVLTHRILLADFYLLETEAFPALPEGYIWIDETELDKYAVPRLIELLHEAVFSNPHK
ncbi:MAG: A/G-specific adenine glycosylase [Bacteroidaceae bacterium]|jgi:A/G-specific adenine glycosylase|nr:A/G-specific adenine glycosylase [Bacteroidaceae bacterium]